MHVETEPFNSEVLEEKVAETPKLVLQPFQEDMLNRMDRDARREYLNELQHRWDSEHANKFENDKEQESKVEVYLWKQLFDATGYYFQFIVLGWSIWVAPLIAPFAFFFAYCFALSARAVAFYPPRREGQNLADTLDAEQWDSITSDIAESEEMKTSIFVGLNAWDNSPVIVPRKVFQEHAHFLGDTGSGKTSMGITPLMTQLIRQGDCSIVVVDLKGDDLAMFHGAKSEAEKSGLPFKWFSNQLEKSTYVFNPLSQKHFSKLGLYQRTDVITGSLGLQYGTDYGRSYFSDANAQLLYRCFQSNPDIKSFDQLLECLQDKSNFRGVNPQLLRDGSHLQAILARLASFEPLNAIPGGKIPTKAIEAGIDLSNAFCKPSVYYFYLSAALGTTSSAEMARLVLYSLLSAAKEAAKPRTKTFVFIDEFQRITAKNLELFLQTARSFDIGVILANQSMSDLKTTDVDLASTVKTNCRFRQNFSVSDPAEITELSNVSGETVIHGKSFLVPSAVLEILTGRTFADAVTLSEQVIPRMSTNQILLAGDHPEQSIVRIRRGEGYAQYGGFPFVLHSCHHISFEEYQRLQNQEWPQNSDVTITPKLSVAQNEVSHSGSPIFKSPLLDE